MNTSWKWVGDFVIGCFGRYSVWVRHDAQLRTYYAITEDRQYPGSTEGECGPKWKVLGAFRRRFPDSAQFCWVAFGDYELAISAW